MPRTPIVLLMLCALLLTAPSLAAQVREHPVAFDSADRVSVITPPLAARLRLTAPVWPVSGDYIDARLYAIEEAAGSFVIVVRRQREVVDRYALDAARRRELATVIDRSNAQTTAGVRPDLVPTFISEPVRGSFVVNQTLLGAFLFGPAASASLDDGAAAAAAYLAVTGGTFFLAANLTKTSSVSRAQNHLSWHSARRGAIAADLTLYALNGNDTDHKGFAAAALAGGILGDVIGFSLAEPMTDAEAHGTSHGSTVLAAMTAGVLGATGAYGSNSSERLAAGLVVGAGVIGYPIGLYYVRTAPYRVTAGDVGTLVTTELLGLSAAASFMPNRASKEVVYGMLTAGFALGAVAGDQLLVRPFDHTESEARMLEYGAGAGALVALAAPVLAQARDSHFYFGAATVGGLAGAFLAEQLIDPQRTNSGAGAATQGLGSLGSRSRVDVRFAPESVLLAGMGLKGNHSILALSF